MAMRMGKPIIGVVPLWDEKKDSLWMLPGYFDGVREAGGIPIMLPLTEEAEELRRLCDLADGILLTGGHDVSPDMYGEEALPSTECCPERDRMEGTLLNIALERDMPVFGICRGLQFLNVYLGGTLYQDIPSQHPSRVCHRQRPPYDEPSHLNWLVAQTPLRELLGAEELRVNSLHHQGVNQLAPGLSAMAVSEDGVVEAAYMPEKRFVWAVQWHPEFAPGEECSKKLFREFTHACRTNI